MRGGPGAVTPGCAVGDGHRLLFLAGGLVAAAGGTAEQEAGAAVSCVLGAAHAKPAEPEAVAQGGGRRPQALTVFSEGFAGKGLFEGEQAGGGALVAAVDVDIEGFELVGVAAAAHAQLEAAVAEGIDDGGVFGDAQGMFKGQHDDRGAQAQALGAFGHRGEKGEGGGQHAAPIFEVMLGHPDGVKAQLVGGVENFKVFPVGLISICATAQMAQKAEAKGIRHRLYPRCILTILLVPRPVARFLHPHCRRR